MMRHLFSWPLLAAGLLYPGRSPAGPHPLPKTDGPVPVQILQTNGAYRLFVNHQPFYIKGAGLGSGGAEKLAACGANSFRTWSIGSRQLAGSQLLDQATSNGLYVTLGLEVGRERQGFDYNDPTAVARQFARLKGQVLQYKNHPALIIWAIGNELNLDAKNPKVWDAVNDLSKMIHQVDPNHLTTTPLAGFGRDVVAQVKLRAPDLDLLSFQMYADIVNLPRYLRESHFEGPYLVTEWGATGHWEARKTAWGAPIEDNSTMKAGFYQNRFQAAIAGDPRCLGSYVFLWGHKQERTPTWYGMFLESGESTAAVDAMQQIWTGASPPMPCPKLVGAWLDGKTACQDIHLHAGQAYPAAVQAVSDSQNHLVYSWELMEESRSAQTGGDFENKPANLAGSISNPQDKDVTIKAPDRPGPYRLFAYVFDGCGHAAHVNIPFYVDAVVSAQASHAPAASPARE